MKKISVLSITFILTILLTSITSGNRASEKSNSELCVITAIVLNKMPSLNDSGSPWDAGSGPDVYCEILNQGTVLFKSTVFEDLDISSLPIYFIQKLPLTLPYLNQSYSIKFYDYENGNLLKSDTYIGGYNFNPKDFLGRETIELKNSTSSISATLVVEWE